MEKRSEARHVKIALQRKLNHLFRKTKRSSTDSAPDAAEDPLTPAEDKETEKDQEPEVKSAQNCSEKEEEDVDSGALSLADLTSEETSPFVTRHAGSTPKVRIREWCLPFIRVVYFAEWESSRRYESDTSSGDQHVSHLGVLSVNNSIVCAH